MRSYNFENLEKIKILATRVSEETMSKDQIVECLNDISSLLELKKINKRTIKEAIQTLIEKMGAH